ncbi:MAG: FtsH protease activity modulator HflK [Gammaproteobacteria bacterium]|nr:MAG: FtsH protease activity modulator HflK [Gammaproteobacteria bacterium]RKZ98133.1 MAG: FtsH protease activity modulator HflK [Gammaproteobacteria bacterium]
MAWNEPGNGDKDPWGKRGNDGPPDLDEVVRNLQRKLGGLFGGGKTSGGDDNSSNNSPIGIGLIAAIILVVWLFSGLYIVEPAERGVELRFGAYTNTTMPGPHWHIPFPIESVEKVDVEGIRTVNIGYRSSGGKSAGNVQSESLMLTEDENIIDLKVEVQFHVTSAADYLFNVENPDLTLRKMTESAVREVVGQTTMDNVFQTGRSEMAKKAETLLQTLLEDYGTGLVVTSFNMPDIQPPAQVQAAFADVVKAGADKVRKTNDAEAYANDILPRARGRGFRIVQEAEGYQSQVVAKAKGETSRFLQVMQEYEKAPAITKERLYLDTMESVYSKSQNVLVDLSKDSNNVLYLPLDRMRAPSSLSPARIDLGNMTTYPSTGTTSTSSSSARDDARSRGGR